MRKNRDKKRDRKGKKGKRKQDSGVLFMYENDYKEADHQPDTRGTGLISKKAIALLGKAFTAAEEADELSEDGELKLEMAGWEKDGRSGKSDFTFILFKAKPPEDDDEEEDEEEEDEEEEEPRKRKKKRGNKKSKRRKRDDEDDDEDDPYDGGDPEDDIPF